MLDSMAVPPQPALYPSSNDAATSAAIALLIHYFDLAPASAQLLVKKWLASYPAIWVRAAVTEALYQGRYKPVSVDQILSFWQRRDRSIVHFNKEFETLIGVPLQGSFKTETDVAIEGNAQVEAANSAATGPQGTGLRMTSQDGLSGFVAASDMTLAEAFGAAAERETAELGLVSEQPMPGQPMPGQSMPGQSMLGQPGAEQSSSIDSLPRPRLMLPGELPGKDLVQQGGGHGPNGNGIEGNDGHTHNDHGRTTSISSANSFLSETQPGTTPSLAQPDGFGGGILDPRPPVSQNTDPALLAEAKSKSIQPPPIGRFTPAADPSGFASRLKNVVQQAVAQTQAGEAQLSLETAIASQLANDPVLGQLSSVDDAAAEAAEDIPAPFAERFPLASASDSVLEERGVFRDELDLELDAIALETASSPAEPLSLGNLPPLANSEGVGQASDPDPKARLEVNEPLQAAVEPDESIPLVNAPQPLDAIAEPSPNQADETSSD